MNNDQKLQSIGKEVMTDIYNLDLKNREWEYFSAVCYGQKLVSYGSEAHGFFFIEFLDNELYEQLFNEKFPDKTEEEVWAEIKEELYYCANKTSNKEALLTIINKY